MVYMDKDLWLSQGRESEYQRQESVKFGKGFFWKGGKETEDEKHLQETWDEITRHEATHDNDFENWRRRSMNSLWMNCDDMQRTITSSLDTSVCIGIFVYEETRFFSARSYLSFFDIFFFSSALYAYLCKGMCT